MGKQVLLDCRLLVGPSDLSGSSNKIDIEDTIQERAVTNFRSGGARELIAGLEEVKVVGEGFWEAGDPGKPDDLFWADRRRVDPISASPSNVLDTAVGGLLYVVEAVRHKVNYGGQVGEPFTWSSEWEGVSPLGRGKCLHPLVLRSSSGDGTAVSLPAVGDTGSAIINVHILGLAGDTTIDLDVVSDSVNTFDAAPTAHLSTGVVSTPTGFSLTVAGPITDTYWRVEYGLAGSSPSALFLVAVGTA